MGALGIRFTSFVAWCATFAAFTTQITAAAVCDAGPLLTLSADKQKLTVSPVFKKDLFEKLLILISKSYTQTRKISPTKLEYPCEITGPSDGDAASDRKMCDESLWLNDNGISYLPPFEGIHGAGKIKSVDHGGFICWWPLGADESGIPVHVVVVTIRGSQGEVFDSLGGFGSPSWMTNFASSNVNYSPDAMQLTTEAKKSIAAAMIEEVKNKELSKTEKSKCLKIHETGFSFHQGFASRFFSFVENGVMLQQIQTVLTKIGIRKYSTLNKKLSKTEVDKQNGAKVLFIVQGHSQGGGVTQIALPFFANYINDYIYGDGGINPTANTVWGIAMSPARAWANIETKLGVHALVGKHNILGFGMLYDIVSVMPFGSNVASIADTSSTISKISSIFISDIFTSKLSSFVMSNFIKYFMSSVLPTEYSNLANLLLNGKCNYETISFWAYGDPKECITSFFDMKERVIYRLIDKISQNATNGSAEQELYFENRKSELEKDAEICKTVLSNIDAISKALAECTKYYNLSHRVGVLAKFSLISNVKAAIENLSKAISLCGGLPEFIAVMHFGGYCMRIMEDSNGKKIDYISKEFSIDSVDAASYRLDMIKCVEQGTKFTLEKEAAINS